MKLKKTAVILNLNTLFGTILLLGLAMTGACSGSTPTNAAQSAAFTKFSPLFHEINWTDGDKPGYTVSLFYDTDNTGHDGTLIVQNIPSEDPTNSYIWNIAGIPAGSYYIYVAINNGTGNTYSYTPAPLVVAHTTTCLDISTRPNLLLNGSFEDGLWEPSAWEVDTPTLLRDRAWEYEWLDDPGAAHSGNQSIKIANTFNGVNSDSAWQDRVIIESQMVDLPTPGGKYLLTAWIKTKNVAAGHVLFRLKYFDGDGNPLTLSGHGVDTYFTGGPHTSAWTRAAFLLDLPHWDSPPYPAPARAEKITLNFSLDNSPGTLWVDDVSLVEITEAEYEQYSPNNRYVPPTIIMASQPVTLPSVPHWGITVQQQPDSGVWWLAGPEGTAFWATGIDAKSNDKLEAVTGLSKSDYTKEAQYRAMHDLNFNQGGRNKEPSGQYDSTQNFIYWLNFSTEPNIDADPLEWTLKDRDGVMMADYGHYFPDVFSPIWQENAVIEAELLLEDDGWVLESDHVLGYWTDNEWAYGDLYDFFWGDVAQLAFVDWLQGKNSLPGVDAVFAATGSNINLNVPAGFEITTPYAAPAELNKAWSSTWHRYNYSAFADIYRRDKPYIRAHNDPLAADFYAFERVIYKIYVDTIIDNIRRVESDFIAQTNRGQHHLIFSNRFDLDRPAAIEALQRHMDIFSRFDVIALNWYPANNQHTTFHAREFMDTIRSTFYDTTGKPLFIAEFGVAAEDADDFSGAPPLIVSRWRGKTVPHQYQRGWAYNNMVSTWANLPYVVGARWYKWSNGYGNLERNDPRNSGAVDDNDNYYAPLTNNMRSLNQQINAIDRSGNFSLDDINWSGVALNLCQP
jgi:hypothetical protein